MATLDAAGIDRAQLAGRAARILLKMVFDDGFFPADPHPGNFFIEPGGRVGLVDFGMVGIVDEATQERLVELLTAVTGQNLDLLVDSFLDLGTARRRVDRAAPREDLRRIM